MGSHSTTGYVNDVPYAFSFSRELAPAWLDFVVTLSGFEPPSRARGFRWCELGCGQGVTAAIMAGTNPTGDFHGIDVFLPHIAQACRLRDSAGITNLTLHALDFATAADVDLPPFDYIVAHGVYSWIDSRGRTDLRRFIDRHLKPGGVVFISYNSMPGWANDTPFQYLVREIAATRPGDSVEQFFDAMKLIAAFTAAGAPALTNSLMGTTGIERLKESLSRNYFAHEFLPPAWQPLYVTQVRAEMASIDLLPAGSASVRDNFDSFVLRPDARAALAALPHGDLRELARDFFLNERFRRDVFVRGRGARRLDDAKRAQRLAESVLDLQRPAPLVEYAMATEAGHLTFDNPAARAIVDAIGPGPKRLAEIHANGSLRAGLLASALALFAANEIRSVESTSVDVGRLNGALMEHVNGTDPLRVLALPIGTGLAVPTDLPGALRRAATIPDDLLPWSDFFRRYREYRLAR
jgi:SAM-dependent methyltransferase